MPKRKSAAPASDASASLALPADTKLAVDTLVAQSLNASVATLRDETIISNIAREIGLDSVSRWNLMEVIEARLDLRGKLTNLNTVDPLTLTEVYRVVALALKGS